MVNASEKRTHPRVSMQQVASVSTQEATLTATIANLSPGGALLVDVEDLTLGSGVRIAFRLASGLPVHLSGRIVRRDGPAGFGVQFFELDDVTREILDDHLLRVKRNAPPLAAKVSVKYHVAVRDNRVILTLSGYLEKEECVELKAFVASELARTRRPLVLIIDAHQFVCCTPDGVKDFTVLLSALPANGLVGGLVGPKSVGVLQLRRAIRDAQIADAFMAFDTVEDAEDAFARLSV